jgi:hypothetical protein
MRLLTMSLAAALAVNAAPVAFAAEESSNLEDWPELVSTAPAADVSSPSTAEEPAEAEPEPEDSSAETSVEAPEAVLEELFANGQVATQYCNLDGVITMDEEWNPNGSFRAIEGITSPDGRVLGKMAHSERRGDSVAINIYGEQDLKIFESGVAYFK